MRVMIGGELVENLEWLFPVMPAAIAIVLVFICVATVAINISRMIRELQEVRDQYAAVLNSYMHSQLQMRRAHRLMYAIFSQADDIEARDHDDPLKRAIMEARAYYMTEVSDGGQRA